LAREVPGPISHYMLGNRAMNAGRGESLYDVHELSAKLSSLRRFGRIVAWVVLGIGFIALAVSTGGILDNPSGWTFLVSVAGLSFGVAIIGISLWMILQSRPGADLVRVDDEGVHLQFRNGRATHLLWTAPRLSFTLEDGSVLPPEVTRGGLLYTLNVRVGETPLTKEAFFDVLTHAQKRGLVVRSGRDRVLMFPPSMWLKVYHVRGSARATRHPGEPI